MTNAFSKYLAIAGFALASYSQTAQAHLSYSGRDFGTFTGTSLQSTTITGQTVPNNWGWADGTDADFSHSHEIKFFKFTLQSTATVTISITSLDPGAMLPGFSLYSGLAHTSPLDYETALTFQYLATLPGPTKEGAFNALDTWRMGNDNSSSYADFSTFTYIGHAADGTAANYGDAAGINGDGVADGFVTATFTLAPGSYTIAVGGANYAGQGVDTTADDITATVTAIPEPGTIGLLVGGALVAGAARLRFRRK